MVATMLGGRCGGMTSRGGRAVDDATIGWDGQGEASLLLQRTTLNEIFPRCWCNGDRRVYAAIRSDQRRRQLHDEGGR